MRQAGKSLAQELAPGLKFGWHRHHRQHDAQVAVRRCARQGAQLDPE